MIVLIDADSLVWSSTYKFKESPEDDGWNTIEEARDKFDEVLFSILNKIEEQHEIERVTLFNGARGNFRKDISPDYKANRKDRILPPILDELHQYLRDQYGSISAEGEETDDLVARYWTELSEHVGRDQVIIVSIDKDYKQLPCIIYNYGKRHQCFYDISEDEARYHFFNQMIIGDSADNVNYCKGYGPKFTEKYLVNCNSRYSYLRKVYELYQKIYEDEAKAKFKECYQLLKLRTI